MALMSQIMKSRNYKCQISGEECKNKVGHPPLVSKYPSVLPSNKLLKDLLSQSGAFVFDSLNCTELFHI